MTTLGHIEMPISETIKVFGNDFDKLDVLFDLERKEMAYLLEELYGNDMPSIAIFKIDFYNIAIIILYRPPPFWEEFKGQKLLMYISPSINLLSHYFKDKMMRCRNDVELSILEQIFNYIEFLSNKKKILTPQ